MELDQPLVSDVLDTEKLQWKALLTLRGEVDDASRQADEAGTAAKFPVPGE